jgi:hypothetical protein
MEQKSFNNLLLKTAFSCMACDGDIDSSEVSLIKSLANDKKIFGDIDINTQLDKLRLEINKDGHQFLRNYFSDLNDFELSEAEELKIIEVSIDTIKADDKIEYSEIKFFKIIRSKLKISNDKILEIHSDFEEYLEQDIISTSYLLRLNEDFFDTENLPQFEPIHELNDGLLKDIENSDNKS